MTIERTRDMELVRRVMSHPKVFTSITDDFSVSADEIRPIEHEGIVYLTVREGHDLLGIFVGAAENGVCVRVHNWLLPEARGRGAEAIKAAIAWTWENTSYVRIIGVVPEHLRLCVAAAKRAGMQVFGRDVSSFMKNGQLEDRLLLGISKREVNSNG